MAGCIGIAILALLCHCLRYTCALLSALLDWQLEFVDLHPGPKQSAADAGESEEDEDMDDEQEEETKEVKEPKKEKKKKVVTMAEEDEEEDEEEDIPLSKSVGKIG